MTTTLNAAHRYRLPALLQDVRVLDLLELCGTTMEAGRLANLSQPTVSRRYRNLARDFDLVASRRRTEGCSYGTSSVMRLLRLGCRAHRLEAGVARIGSDLILQPLLAGREWLLPSPPRFRATASWLELVREGVLDGALISGLELPSQAVEQGDGLELLQLGCLPMALAVAPASRSAAGWDGRPAVLVPGRNVAGGLQQALRAQGLELRAAGNGCKSPAQWVERLRREGLAMPLARLEPIEWWQPLRPLPLPEPLRLPVWLALPADWCEHSVLAHAAEQLRRFRRRGESQPAAAG